jgi:hypothetical protein
MKQLMSWPRLILVGFIIFELVWIDFVARAAQFTWERFAEQTVSVYPSVLKEAAR